MVRKAVLRDWSRIEALWERFKASPLANRMEGDITVVEAYFSASLTNEGICFAVLERGAELTGFCIGNEASTQALDEGRKPIHQPNTFVRAIHIEPGSLEDSLEFRHYLNNWARCRNHRMILGHCPIDFTFKAYERLHGVKPLYVVVGKEVNYG